MICQQKGCKVATCVSPQLVYVSSTSNGQTSLGISVYTVDTVQQSPVTSCNAVVLSGTEAANYLNASQPFDPVLAASFWSFALVFSVGSYLVAKNAGLILSAIKRW